MFKNKNQSINYLKIFLLIVFVGALLSIFFKVFRIIDQHKLKGDSYNILYLSNDAYAMQFNTREKVMNVVLIKNAGNQLSKNSRIKNSLILGIPFDGMIDSKDNLDLFFSNKKIMSLILSGGGNLNNLNEFDIAKIYFGYKFSGLKKTIKTINDIEDEGAIEQYASDFFINKNIFNNKSSLEVVNSTGVNGLGSLVSQMLKNEGYNVVSVTSRAASSGGSKIVNRTIDSAYFKKLAIFFNLPEQKEEGIAVADITIILQNDWVKNNKIID